MSKNELIQKINNAYEMVIIIDGRRFTICDEYEKGFSIAEWDKPETEMYFTNGEQLVESYSINGKKLADYAGTLIVEDYTGFVE